MSLPRSSVSWFLNDHDFERKKCSSHDSMSGMEQSTDSLGSQGRSKDASPASTTPRKPATKRSSIVAAPVYLISSLAGLTRAEKAEADRVKLSSSVSWFSDVLRFRASTLPRVWSSVLGFTVFSTAIAIAKLSYGKEWKLSNNVVPIISVIVGLLLVFRNSTAFSRWEDGRKTFGAQVSTVRSMARYTWINVGAAPYDPKRANPYQHENYAEADRQEKREALRMMVACVVATKRHVRGEYGLAHDDLNTLVPSALVKKMNVSMLDEIRQELPAEPTETDPLLSLSDAEAALVGAQRPSLPLPLVIIHRLSLYFAKARAKGFLDQVGPAGYNTVQGYLNALTAEMGTVERLSTLPIPAIYGIHLKQVVTVFLVILPFTLVGDLSLWMVPFVTVYAFILQGIEGIATEIEAPFGSDPSDLPLDLIAAEIRNEVEHIIQRLPECIESD